MENHQPLSAALYDLISVICSRSCFPVGFVIAVNLLTSSVIYSVLL